MEKNGEETGRDSLETSRLPVSGFLFRMLSGGSRELVFWFLQTLFWCGIGVLGFLMMHAFHAEAPDVKFALLIRMITGFVLTAALRYIFRMGGFRRLRRWPKYGLAAGCCLAFGLIEMLVIEGWIATGGSYLGSRDHVAFDLVLVRFFVLSLWSTLYFAVHLVESEHALELRATQAELAAREFELRHLQVQMSPYFVFNALETVLACKNDPAAVEEVTQSLSEYLKFLLQETRPLETLGRELDALEKFLTAQTARFKGSVACRIHCEPAARKVLVPPMMIQPLLEDAFHNRPQSLDLPLQIWLTAHIKPEGLEVMVSSTGEETATVQAHTGVEALRLRLELLLGPGARVERHTEDGWIRVAIHIPMKSRPDSAKRP